MKTTGPFLILIFAGLSFLSPGRVNAEPRGFWREAPPDVRVDFLVAGRPLPIHGSRDGEGFVAVPRWGVEYEIRISNQERHDRVLFVIGVDGLSVMDGSRASQHSGGYVLEPGESTRIRGWRRGLDHVAAFTFTERSDSYAGRTGRPGHIGEIGVWAVREESRRPSPPILTPQAGASRERAADSAFRGRGETGTGYGDELVDRVRTTSFARSNSVRYLEFRYGLRPPGPEPIPYDDVRRPGGSFAPPPPGWKRNRD